MRLDLLIVDLDVGTLLVAPLLRASHAKRGDLSQRGVICREGSVLLIGRWLRWELADHRTRVKLGR